jgi:hypothetical protein
VNDPGRGLTQPVDEALGAALLVTSAFQVINPTTNRSDRLGDALDILAVPGFLHPDEPPVDILDLVRHTLDGPRMRRLFSPKNFV